MTYSRQDPADWANPTDNFDNWEDDEQIYILPDDDDSEDKPDSQDTLEE